jgi:AraC-like DNA-binding protein/quercetin dioxygenase-like cupin family protein
MISTRPVPVTMGSPVFRSLELDGFAVIEAWFPAREYLARHTHDGACVAVMLEGSFDLAIGGRVHHCPPSAVATEPAGETHANSIGDQGARVAVIQPDPARTELLRPFARILDHPSHRHHAGVAACAARTPPPWLLRAQELVHARFREPLQVGAVAREVDVHPGHLARAFRQHFRMPLGSYVRRLRLEWVAAELLGSEDSLASVALAAGFADQSHLTRAFKCHTGLTPQAYRRAKPPPR